MTLVMTLLARDEIDVVDSWLEFHLNAGVDMVIATDNLSQDGTTEVLEAYARSGIERLWSHQREAAEHAFAGRHVAVVTPTASGKTLCYNLPVLAATLA